MKKSKKTPPRVEIKSFGRYEKWDRDSKAIPEFVELTTEVVAEVGVEFGMLINIYQARGRYLDFVIEHPPFKDENGEVMPPFEGSYQVRKNPFTFFLGDTIWEPVEDKRGDWTMKVFFDGELVASKTIKLV